MARELPPPTPGPAYLDAADDDGDFMLPQALHHDAVAFYGLAVEYDGQDGHDARAVTERYVRAAVVAAFASLESQLNMAAFGHAVAHREKLDPFVHDVLSELETGVDEQGRLQKRKRRMALTARLSFLTAFLSGREFPRGGRLWQRFVAAIELRDSFVHPKPPFRWDYTPEAAREVIDTVSEILTEVHRLMGLPSLSWWNSADDFLAHGHDISHASGRPPDDPQMPQ